MSSSSQACTVKRIQVTREQLPLSCPPQDDRVWDAHPRVYLPIEKMGHVVCPYCETQYILQSQPADDEATL